MTRSHMTRRTAVAAALAAAFAPSAAPGQAGGTDGQERPLMRIAIEVDAMRLTASLFDNLSAQDFAAMLPLDLTLEDYASVEKIGYLPRKLRIEGSGPFDSEAIGDIAYYAPWGNLIFFYGPYRYSRGLIRLGRLDSGIAPLLRGGRFNIRIERLT
ncbi:MFS transporter [Mesorhizobium sp. B261B1A]|nr:MULTISPECIES: cyclophilin-like fold protein [unclassified Mesorhizobium]MCA0058349.1 MFS transporter [Mesorhizobium sp. B261B1A]